MMSMITNISYKLFCTSVQINEYNAQQGGFSKWSRQVYKQGWHPGWLARKEPIVHLTFNPQNNDQIIVQDQHSFTIIDRSLVGFSSVTFSHAICVNPYKNYVAYKNICFLGISPLHSDQRRRYGQSQVGISLVSARLCKRQIYYECFKKNRLDVTINVQIPRKLCHTCSETGAPCNTSAWNKSPLHQCLSYTHEHCVSHHTKWRYEGCMHVLVTINHLRSACTYVLG